ncbi:MAG: hypothetical protein ACRD3T_20390, partial [Terriglobia bacterium]
VQDTLRALCFALNTQMIPASDKWGADFVILSTAPKRDQWLAQADAAERARGYETALQDFTREHRQAVVGLRICADERRYERSTLDAVYISAMGIQRYCQLERLPLPAFWFPNEVPQSQTPPRRVQLDKVAYQAIARTLWDQNAEFTIQALIEHPAIRQYRNGTQYTEKTLRKWLSEVDPRLPEDKIGRPSKSDSQKPEPE